MLTSSGNQVYLVSVPGYVFFSAQDCITGYVHITGRSETYTGNVQSRRHVLGQTYQVQLQQAIVLARVAEGDVFVLSPRVSRGTRSYLEASVLLLHKPWPIHEST